MKTKQGTFEPAGMESWGRGAGKGVRKMPRWMMGAGILLVGYGVAMWVKPSDRLGSLFSATVALVCFFSGFMHARQCWWRLSAVRWPEVRGTVAGVRVKRDESPAQAKDADGTFLHEHWDAEVVYRYEAAGRRFQAREAVAFSDTKEKARRAVSSWRVGDSVGVLHHPARPGICLLESQLGKKWKVELGLSVFLFAVGGAFAAFTWALWIGRVHG